MLHSQPNDAQREQSECGQRDRIVADGPTACARSRRSPARTAAGKAAQDIVERSRDGNGEAERDGELALRLLHARSHAPQVRTIRARRLRPVRAARLHRVSGVTGALHLAAARPARRTPVPSESNRDAPRHHSESSPRFNQSQEPRKPAAVYRPCTRDAQLRMRRGSVCSPSASSSSYSFSPGRSPVKTILMSFSAEAREPDQVAREIDDAHRLAHVEHEDLAALAHRTGLQHELRRLGNRHEDSA